MTKLMSVLAAAFVVSMAATPLSSGSIGIYAIIQRVEMLPNDSAPESIRVWGAFSFVNGTAQNPVAISAARRGQMHFQLPRPRNGGVDPTRLRAVRAEWADLKSVAGSGTAVGFGSWRYFGNFGRVDPTDPATVPDVVDPFGVTIMGSFGVAPDTARARPALGYVTEYGIVRLAPDGSHASIVQALREALGR